MGSLVSCKGSFPYRERCCCVRVLAEGCKDDLLFVVIVARQRLSLSTNHYHFLPSLPSSLTSTADDDDDDDDGCHKDECFEASSDEDVDNVATMMMVMMMDTDSLATTTIILTMDIIALHLIVGIRSAAALYIVIAVVVVVVVVVAARISSKDNCFQLEYMPMLQYILMLKTNIISVGAVKMIHIPCS